jgi:hypothetical protein
MGPVTPKIRHLGEVMGPDYGPIHWKTSQTLIHGNGYIAFHSAWQEESYRYVISETTYPGTGRKVAVTAWTISKQPIWSVFGNIRYTTHVMSLNSSQVVTVISTIMNTDHVFASSLPSFINPNIQNQPNSKTRETITRVSKPGPNGQSCEKTYILIDSAFATREPVIRFYCVCSRHHLYVSNADIASSSGQGSIQ